MASKAVSCRIPRFAVGTLLAAAAVFSGCANRQPAAPLPPVQPIARLAVLPVVYQAELDAGSGTVPPPRTAGAFVPVYVHRGQSSGSAYGQAAVGAAIGVGIVMLIEHQRKQKWEAHADAIRTVAIDPAALVQQRLQEKLRARGITLETVSADDAAKSRHVDDFSAITPASGAVLDVRISDYGFDHSNRAGGFAPMLGASVTVNVPGDDQSESYGYWADWRSRPDDPRWFTTPPSMTYPTLDALKADVEAVRRGLEDLIERVATRMADDVAKRVGGQRAE